MRNFIGERLGDFQIVRELGRGGMGVVYEARQVSLNRRVALKVLSGGLGLTPKAVQRFRREAEAAARLHHTNIVPIYATGEEQGTHFYAMELIDGPSLDQVIRQMRAGDGKEQSPSTASGNDGLAPALAETGPYVDAGNFGHVTAELSSSSLGSGSGYFDTVARMVAEVADALDYAHREGVIHRDIKPSNLLLSPAGRLSINDFGLARILEQPGMTMTGEFVGTPAYMSPEQIAAGRTPIDHRTDVYSLGATLYELLTQRPPFTGERRDQVLAQILHKEPRAPRKVNAKVPVDLETICLKALEKDPDRRYQTAGAMAEDLRRYVNRFAISARRAGAVQRLVKWVRRRPGVAATAVLAGVLAVVAAGLAYQGYVTEQNRLADKQQQERLLAVEKRQSALERALLVAMSGDLDAAENAIAQAERQGVSTGQVRLLRGELAYYRGNVKKAIEHLEQAVQLLPAEQSVAARGLLVVAYVYAMRIEDAARELQVLDSLEPVTVEDFLFKGAALGQWEEEQGLVILDQAVKQRPSSAIARLFRSDALANLAANRANPDAADRAIEDAETAKSLLADASPIALWYCGNAYQLAAFVYKHAGLDEKYRTAVAKGQRDAEALEPFKHIPDAAYFRAYYYWYFGQKDRTLDELRALAKRPDTLLISYAYAVILLWRGGRADLQEARATLDLAPENGLLSLLNCWVAAELDGCDAALERYRRGIPLITNGVQRVYFKAIPLLLGKADLAKAESRADRHRDLTFRPSERAFLQASLDYLAGDGNDISLLRAAVGSQRDECHAHFFIGMTRLAEGDRKRARAEFQRALTTACVNTMFYDLSAVVLARLEKDAYWPPWIPVQK